MDLKLLLEYYEGAHRYHHTAPISNFYALREGLALVREEGVEARFARHHTLHLEFVRRMEAAGFCMFIPDECQRIATINTLRVPPGVDAAKVRKRLLDEALHRHRRRLQFARGKVPRASSWDATVHLNVDLLSNAIGMHPVKRLIF